MSFLDEVRKIEGYSNITEKQLRQMDPSKKIELIRKVSKKDKDPNINEADYGQEQYPGNHQEFNGSTNDINNTDSRTVWKIKDENGVEIETRDRNVYDEYINRINKKNNGNTNQYTGNNDFLKNAFGEENLDKHKKGIAKQLYGDKFDESKFDANKGFSMYNDNNIDAVAKYMATHKDEINQNFNIEDYYEGQNLTRYNSRYGEQLDYIEKGKFIDNALSDIDKQYSQDIEQFRKDAGFKDNSDLVDKAKKHQQFTEEEYTKYQVLKNRRNELISKYDEVANQYNQKYGTNYTADEFYKEYEKKYKGGKTGTDVTNEGFYRERLRKDFGYLDYDTKEVTQDANGNSIFATIEPEKIDPNKIDLDAMKNSGLINDKYNELSNKDFGDYADIFDDKNNVVDSNIKKLADLKRRGIDIGAEGEEVLKYGAASIGSGAEVGDTSLTAINKNASILADKYNISNDNIQYLNTKSTNKNPISLSIDNDGKVSFSKSTWNKMTSEEREKYKNFKGTEDLTELSENISNRGYMKDAISKNNFKGTEDEFLEGINKKWNSTKDATSKKYGLSRTEQFKEMGASDEMISKLEKGERLTGKDLKGFSWQKFDESYVELGKMNENTMNNMIDSYKKEGITSLNNLDANNNKRVKAAAIYENIIKKSDNSLNDISDDFEFNLDVSDEKAVRKFLENINANKTTGDQINVAKMMSEYVTKSKSKNTKLSVGSIVDAYSNNGTTGVSNLIKDTNDKNAKDMFNKAFDKVIGILEKSGNEDLKNLGGHFKKMSRDDSFTKDVIEKTAFKETVDKAPEFKTLQDGKGMEIAKKAMGNKYVKIGAGIAAVAGVGAMAIGAMNNAAEERERKRQEMNMLIASQNSSIRGGY